ncbi:recombinase family protein [Crossiella sp. CA198]|uniref:recombinase family protein n=1 Tax=Crossiella sp. CA198 TaxID=3455607 RepID=UPI003F8D4D84
MHYGSATDTTPAGGWVAIRYHRISDLKDTSTSIERQEPKTLAQMHALGATEHAVYADVDKSAYIPGVYRDDWEKGMEDLYAKRANLLIVVKVDRATRQGILQAAEIIRVVVTTGCRFISIEDGIDSLVENWELSLAFAAHMAQRSSKDTSGRYSDARDHLRNLGLWIGRRPYGNIVTSAKKLILEPFESQIQRNYASAVLYGDKSTGWVADSLNARGIDTPSWASRKRAVAKLERIGEPEKAANQREKPMKYPNHWSESTVRSMLTSPVLAGYMPHNGDFWHHGKTGDKVRCGEGIVSLGELLQLRELLGIRAGQWERAQVLRNIPASRSQKTGQPASTEATGYVACRECGADSTPDWKTKAAKRAALYRCMRKAAGGDCIGSGMVDHAVHTFVGNAIVSHIATLDPNDPKVLALAERWEAIKNPGLGLRIQEIDAELATEQAYVDNLDAEKLRGVMFSGPQGDEKYDRLHGQVNERIANLNAERAQLKVEAKVLGTGFIDQIEAVTEYWENAGPTERREVYALLIHKVWISKAPRNGAKPTPDRLTFWFVGEPEPEFAKAFRRHHKVTDMRGKTRPPKRRGRNTTTRKRPDQGEAA